MKCDEETEYIKIINAVKSINPDIIFNICRWKFPGEWAITKADSWRVSYDIRAGFKSVLKIIDINAGLYPWASAGHYNDMDMLEVGREMTYDEDKTHFSMWCMLNSPLLAGNDLTRMSAQTLENLSNTEVIALNQDAGFKQAFRIYRENNIEVLGKPLGTQGDFKAIAIMNRGEVETGFYLSSEMINVTKGKRHKGFMAPQKSRKNR